MLLPNQLELNNWKRFENQILNLDFIPIKDSAGLIITGANGSGKTSILEAYYSLLTSKPWPGTKFTQSLKLGTNYFGIRTPDNQWFLNGQISPRGRILTKSENPSEPNPRRAVFWYQPNFNYWLGLSRGDKLKILDMLIIMSGNSSYSQSLTALNQSIKGKQNLLNQLDQNPEVDTIILNQLNNSIFHHSYQVWLGRKNFFDSILSNSESYAHLIETDIKNLIIRREYSNVLGRRSLIETNLPLEPTSLQWQSIWNRESVSGQVLYGAHRDNFDFEIQGQSLDNILSRGEKRLFTFFVIQLAAKTLKTKHPNQKIIFLADDIFNELDDKRNVLLFEEITSSMDYFLITSAQVITGLEDWSVEIEEILK